MSLFSPAEIDYVVTQPLGRLASVDPWTPRGIEIRAVAETVDDGGVELGRRLGAGFEFHPAHLRIRPRRILSGGLAGGSLVARDVA